MKKFIIITYRVIGIIAIIFGVIAFIAGLGKGEDGLAFGGFAGFTSGLLLVGLSFIVEAACIYIDRNKSQLQ